MEAGKDLVPLLLSALAWSLLLWNFLIGRLATDGCWSSILLLESRLSWLGTLPSCSLCFHFPCWGGALIVCGVSGSSVQ